MEADDPRRTRRKGPAAKASLNAARSAEGMLSSFGPGKPGCFGEGGNHAAVSGPLSGKAFESEDAFKARMLAYKEQEDAPVLHPKLLEAGTASSAAEADEEAGGAAEEGEDGEEGAAAGRDPYSVPIPQRDYADYCNRKDQEWASRREYPGMSKGDDFQDAFKTEEEKQAQEEEIDDLLANFKTKGNVRKARKNPHGDVTTMYPRDAHHTPAEQLLADYKAQAETEEQRKIRLGRTAPRTAHEKAKEQAESMAFYRKQRGLE